MKEILGLLTIVLFIGGCATSPQPIITPIMPAQGMPSGIYHRVVAGQTLWGISKMYGVDIDDVVRINRIPEASQIEISQLVFIPTTKKNKVVFASAATPSSSGDDFIWPVKGRVIARFGESVNNTKNKGLDIQATYGAEVHASRDGVVNFYSDKLKGFGKTLIIQHDDIFSTVYARNSQVLVKVGDRVKRGMLIAKAGASGRDKDTYLHFEIRKRHVPQNPYYYLP